VRVSYTCLFQQLVPFLERVSLIPSSSLRVAPETLASLRERLFVLWGEVEERKSANRKAMRKQAAGDKPPDSSDDESPHAKTTIPNRPFSCCIRQYGIKVRENDPCQANAGDGKRWQRLFGMFGTKLPYGPAG
jgi:protection of telomeres protein 1